MQRPDLQQRPFLLEARLDRQREQGLRRGGRGLGGRGRAVTQRRGEIKLGWQGRENFQLCSADGLRRHRHLPGRGRRRGQSPNRGTETGFRKEVDWREHLRLQGQRHDSPAVHPDRPLRQQWRMGRQASRACHASLLRPGLIACPAGTGVSQASQGQFVLQSLMGFAVCVGTELSVRESAQKRQPVPAIETPHSASVILPLLSSAREGTNTMRKFTEFVALCGGPY